MVGAARRRVVAVLAGLVLVAGAALVVYRVFAPGEVLAEPTSTYPVAPTPRPPAVLGTLPAAPLIVDGRLRVVADKRQVRADGPVDSRYLNTPYWSFRRWPAELIGVVAAGGTVVTRWSDGELVGLDARTGRDVWRAKGEKPAVPEYAGRRTGAQTVYAPPGLFLSGDTVVVAGPTRTQAFALATGAPGWQQPAQPCPTRPDPSGFSTADGRVAVLRACDSAVRLFDVATGAAAGVLDLPAHMGPETVLDPLDCATPRTACAGVRVDSFAERNAWLFVNGEIRPAGLSDDARIGRPAPLAGPGAQLVGGLAVTVDGTAIVASGIDDRAERWRRELGDPRLGDPDLTILAAADGRVYVLTADRDLVTLDGASGAVVSRFRYTYFAEKTDWRPGWSYAAGGYLLTERLDDLDAPDDADYYFDPQPVILAAV
ncbi:PQQ-binding-like beta-propeller repeat protein [Asanoa sp. WMMD1127]|uniref:outer membrane protein assembly factor BamB family protein n=1 Tax=Asanoa sp. WMMD1127 TaxID=3016107 RepID=UPI00241702CE|nr:PQQ-binding-like beta-propeller repeat protein [Asanoa sp. WMMD1127]MDG4822464.1 PQQ-binding-like beta-propeller repeat protein [Asanoa sp. WMMD1127]